MMPDVVYCKPLETDSDIVSPQGQYRYTLFCAYVKTRLRIFLGHVLYFLESGLRNQLCIIVLSSFCLQFLVTAFCHFYTKTQIEINRPPIFKSTKV